MKILYVTSNGGIHDYRFLKKLVEDYDVLLLHYASGMLIDEIKKIKGLQIISKRPLLRPFPLLSEYFHFKKIYNSFKPDIVHTGYVWQVGILAALTDVHPHLSMPWGSDILVQPDKSRIKKFIARKVMNQCDHVQCDAESVKKKIMKDYGISENKITVFARGIDLKYFIPGDKIASRIQLGLNEKKFIVIFNRHLSPIYGISHLLEAFKIFSHDKNDVLMIMISDGKLREETEKFIAYNKLDTKIKILRNVHNTEISVYLNASDVYISTSLSDGASLSLLEAMAMGLGIVVTNVPAITEWISEINGFVVPFGNLQKTARALENYYANKELIASHGRLNVKIAKERADWDKNYLTLKEIYNTILSN